MSASPDERLPGEPVSLWVATAPTTDYPTLQGKVEVDVAVIGGGIVGLTPLASATRFVRENFIAAGAMFGDRFERLFRRQASDSTLAALVPGEAAVLNRAGEKTAVYRDTSGRVYAVSAICTHQGCTVEWNPADATWDCPCHGSRFHPDGKVLQGPAAKDLPQRPTV